MGEYRKAINHKGRENTDTEVNTVELLSMDNFQQENMQFSKRADAIATRLSQQNLVDGYNPISYLVREDEVDKTRNNVKSNLNDTEKRSAISIMDYELYYWDNHSLHAALNKAYNNLGPPWFDCHKAWKYGRSGRNSTKDFYYSNDTTDDRRKKYKAHLRNVKYHRESWFPFEKLV